MSLQMSLSAINLILLAHRRLDRELNAIPRKAPGSGRQLNREIIMLPRPGLVQYQASPDER